MAEKEAAGFGKVHARTPKKTHKDLQEGSAKKKGANDEPHRVVVLLSDDEVRQLDRALAKMGGLKRGPYIRSLLYKEGILGED